MNIRIAVLDSSHNQRNETLTKLDGFARRKHADIKTRGFASGADLLNDIDKNGQYDIYILETNLPDINGFYIARELRNRYRDCKIIYYTSNRNSALNAFEVQADNYVIKPTSDEKFDSVMDAAIRSIERNNTSTLIEVRVSTGFMRIPTDEISYVNIVNRALCYHMQDGTTIRSILLREPFRNAVEVLLREPTFCIAGASLLINLDAVRVVGRNAILFSHGEWVVPPRTSFKSIYYAWNSLNSNCIS